MVAESCGKLCDAIIMVRVKVELEDILLVYGGIQILIDPSLEPLDYLWDRTCYKQATSGLILSKGQVEIVSIQEHHLVKEVSTTEVTHWVDLLKVSSPDSVHVLGSIKRSEVVRVSVH